MKKLLFMLFAAVFAASAASAQFSGGADKDEVYIFADNPSETQFSRKEAGIVPFSTVFYKIGTNALHSFTYNYGLNYIVASLGSYALVASGADWRWNRMSYNNEWVSYSGLPFGIIGFVLPIAAPIYLYVDGRKQEDIKLQVTGLALGQSALLALTTSFVFKSFTGRREPGIMEHHFSSSKDNETDDYSGDWAFGFMKRGVFNGWPSSHTIVAFSMATTLAQLYPENTKLKVYAYIYAGLTGFSVSLSSHWLSEAFAGALMGYVIGKSVGDSFNELLNNDKSPKKLSCSLYPSLNGITFAVIF